MRWRFRKSVWKIKFETPSSSFTILAEQLWIAYIKCMVYDARINVIPYWKTVQINSSLNKQWLSAIQSSNSLYQILRLIEWLTLIYDLEYMNSINVEHKCRTFHSNLIVRWSRKVYHSKCKITNTNYEVTSKVCFFFSHLETFSDSQRIRFKCCWKHMDC